MPNTCVSCGHHLPKRSQHKHMCSSCVKASAGLRPERALADEITYDDVFPAVSVGVGDTPAFQSFVADGLPAGTSVADYWRLLQSATNG